MTEPSRTDFDQLWSTLAATHDLNALGTTETVRAETPLAAATNDAARDAAELPALAISLPGAQRSRAAPSAPQQAHDDLVVGELLGEGGMGKVFLARQRSLERDIALKVLHEDAREDERSNEADTSLLHEARITGALEHPNIVPVHVLGRAVDGRPVMVMKRVEGVAWRTLLREPEHPAWAHLLLRHGDPLAAHLDVLIQVCDALQFAHASGVMHRDLKPDNVMVGSFGEVYLLDWGVAVRRGSRAFLETAPRLVGTPAYMAPEMTEGRWSLVGERTDVYLLGATLHEVLTGSPRHEGATLLMALWHAYESKPVTYDPAVPAELASLCNEATERDPDRRPASAAAFQRRIADYLRHRASLALSASAADSLQALRALPGVEEGRAGALEGPLAWRAMTECRFGYLQALREWDGNEAARDGLQTVLEHMFARELSQRNVAAAQSLYEELPVKRAELEARLAELARALDEERKRDERLRTHRAEMDASVSSGARVWVFAAMFVAVTVLGGVLTTKQVRTGVEPTSAQVIAVNAFICVAVGAAMFALRKRVLANVMSRRLSWMTLVTMAFASTVDIATYLRGGPSREIFAPRLFLMAACFGVSSVQGFPGFALLTFVATAGAVACLAVPLFAGPIMVVASNTLILATIWLLHTGRLQPSRDGLLS